MTDFVRLTIFNETPNAINVNGQHIAEHSMQIFTMYEDGDIQPEAAGNIIATYYASQGRKAAIRIRPEENNA